MANWFEDNPTRSVIVYTVLVAASTWAISEFILEENKLNYHRAQIEAERSRAEQYAAKVSILEADNAKLRLENEGYLNWLEQVPDALPLAQVRMRELGGEIDALRSQLLSAEKELSRSGLYQLSHSVRRSSAVVDDRSGLMVALHGIDTDEIADLTVRFPGKAPLEIAEGRAGDFWSFTSNGRTYELMLTDIEWLSGVTFRVSELAP
ncbi:hypothetical protein [Hyphococcus sp.]|uniref:hypothetical protein n=1 Tax=Hyphococcus sp. TaxID=2038636 RepID=UPI0020836EA0|nr:MAG: hypothetical protein DHS20C04_31870 [Marinicaulis sp.]